MSADKTRAPIVIKLASQAKLKRAFRPYAHEPGSLVYLIERALDEARSRQFTPKGQ